MLKITTIKVQGKDLSVCPHLKLMLTDTNKCFYFNSDLEVQIFLQTLSKTSYSKVLKEMAKTSSLLKTDIHLYELCFRVSSVQSINYNDLGCWTNCIITCYC